MTEASSDHGTVLPPRSSALIVSEDGQISLFVAELDDDVPVPRLVLLLGAVLIRSTDEEWVEEMLEELEDKLRN